MKSRFLALLALAVSTGIPGADADRSACGQPHDTSASISNSSAPEPETSDTLRVMSFNIRYYNPGDGEDAWPNRADGVSNLVRQREADLIGLQEALPQQLADLEQRLPGYKWLGTSRGGEGSVDEYSAILYRADAVDLVEHGTFWLSDTPDVPASRGWDAALPRIATWGVFRTAGDDVAASAILHLNTHFDHRGERARVESARLIRTWLAEHAADRPVIVTGDFNTLPDSEPIAALTDTAAAGQVLADALHTSESPHEGPLSTWNGFDEIVSERRIDFVFTGNDVRVMRHEIIDERLPSGRFPSDHLPVLAEIIIPVAGDEP